MKKLREIIRLEQQAVLSHRRISQATGVSRPVVVQIIHKAQKAGLKLEAV